jgi:DNA-binding NtrC family response regulator
MAFQDLLRHTEPQTEFCPRYAPAHSFNGKGTVLVVDDEPIILRGLTRLLEGTSYSVVPCQTPSQAIDRVLCDDVVLVVTDMMMLEMSGLELLRILHELDAGLPVVLMSGHSDPDRIMEALECGASEYLIKPLDIPRLRQVVERLSRPPSAVSKDGNLRMSAGS